MVKRLILLVIIGVIVLQQAPSVHSESLFQIKRKDQVTQDWEIHVDYPIFDQLKNKELQNKVNHSITSKLDRQFDMVQRGADETHNGPILYYEESDVYMEKDFYSVVMTSHVSRNDQNHSSVSSINFENGKRSELLPLTEVVYMDELNKEVNRIMAQDVETYSSDTFDKVREDTAFYIEDNHLVLIFNKFEVAAGVQGTPQMQIPLDAVKRVEEDVPKAPLPSSKYL
ncbi:DUF3298 and DUF4163 domain-containing protein [Halobacillus litoralis]|uniref:DUF3298 and DUF4163 domain-containing protein n=1 Tax=Halobacillus litoralis TaxID=45668 RepID=UPI001CD73A8A|nr:DUF3298 and DUF4163 domain-containing protein [Halobacillus litoralis]MCA0971828.1 DUF3298 and DUF4163 domain-containing protein [Halobacillus litoralis]